MKFKILFFFLILNFSLQAGDFRGGDIHIEQYTAYSVQANINVNLVIHSEVDQIIICWGDGSCDILSSPQILENPSFDTKTLHFYWIHEYNQHGFYDITIEECCWSDDIFNMNLISEQDLVLEASFKLLDPSVEPYNVMPYTATLPISSGNQNTYLVYNSFVNIPENDESTFELCSVDVINYFMLDEIFAQPNTFYLDPLTGGFSWFSPPAPGFFIVKVCITTTRSGQLISETSRDILIAIDNTIGIEDLSHATNFNIKCFPNPAQDFVHFNYHLKEKSIVEIDLFDTSGKKIKTLFSGEKMSGDNEELFDLQDLHQGSYLFRIISADKFGAVPFFKK